MAATKHEEEIQVSEPNITIFSAKQAGGEVDLAEEDLLGAVEAVIAVEENLEDNVIEIKEECGSYDSDCGNSEAFYSSDEKWLRPYIGGSLEELLSHVSESFCPLCSDQKYFRLKSALIHHFCSVHLKHCIRLHGVYSALCSLSCLKELCDEDKMHYHCPHCSHIYLDKQELCGHFQSKHKKLTLEGYESSDSKNFVEEDAQLTRFSDPKESKMADYHCSKPKLERIVTRPSVGATLKEIAQQLTLPHCSLCGNGGYYKIKPELTRHFRQAHLNHFLMLHGIYSVLCMLNCPTRSWCRKTAHYHCPYCDYANALKQRVKCHFQASHERRGVSVRTESTTVDCDSISNAEEGTGLLSEASECENNHMLEGHPGSVMYHFRPSVGVSLEKIAEQSNFPYCFLCIDGRQYKRKSVLSRHLQNVHLSHFLKFKDRCSVLCKLNCSAALHSGKEAHYHCPLCRYVNALKQRVKYHFHRYHGEGVSSKQFSEPADCRDSKYFLTEVSRNTAGNLNFDQRENQADVGLERSVIFRPSVNTSLQKIAKRVCLPLCTLCSDEKEYRIKSELIRHIRHAHLNHFLRFDGIYSVLCKLNCPAKSWCGKKAHYHCPCCDYTSVLKQRVKCHYQRKHAKRDSSLSPSDLSNSSDSADFSEEDAERELMENIRVFGIEAVEAEPKNPHLAAAAVEVLDETKKDRNFVSIELQGNAEPVKPVKHLLERSHRKPSVAVRTACVKTTTYCRRKVESFDVQEQHSESALCHPSIALSVDDIEKQATFPHCHLCCNTKTYPTKLSFNMHFQHVHLNHQLQLDKFVIVRCRLRCVPDAPVSHSHFHCPYCPVTAQSREKLLTHIQHHSETRPDGRACEERSRRTSDTEYVHKRKANIHGNRSIHNRGSEFLEDLFSQGKLTKEVPYEEDKERILYSPSVASSVGVIARQAKYPLCSLCYRKKHYASYNLFYRHVRHSHLNHRVHFDKYVMVKCKLDCTASTHKYSHFHCPFCTFLHHSSSVVLSHAERHYEMTSRKALTSGVLDKEKISNLSRLVVLDKFREVWHLNFENVEKTSLAPGVAASEDELLQKLKLPLCILCTGKKFLHMSSLKRHFNFCHLRHSIEFGNFIVVMCKLMSCITNSLQRKTSHYHCPYCKFFCPIKHRLPVHIQAAHNNQIERLPVNVDVKVLPESVAVGKMAETGFSPPRSVASSIQELIGAVDLPYCYLCEKVHTFVTKKDLMAHFMRYHVKRVVHLGSQVSILCKRMCKNDSGTGGHYHCPFCPKGFRTQKRLLTHAGCHHTFMKREKVRKYNSGCIAADKERGIYIVCKTVRGIKHPIHVVKKVADKNNITVACSQKKCQKDAALYSGSDRVSSECKHLLQVNLDLDIPQQYDDWNVEDVQNSFHVSEEQVDMYNSIITAAAEQNAPALVKWEANQRYIYFSIFSTEVTAGNIRRVFVQYDKKHNTLKCHCRAARRGNLCGHKVVSQVYINCKLHGIVETQKLQVDALIKYKKYLIPSAYEQVSRQINLAYSALFLNEFNSDTTSCQCRCFRLSRLPCRHIFANRIDESTDLFSKQLVGEQWVQKETLWKEEESEESMVGVVDITEDGDVSTAYQKYALYAQCHKLTTLGTKSRERLKVIEDLIKIWEGGQEVQLGKQEKKDRDILEEDTDHTSLTVAPTSNDSVETYTGSVDVIDGVAYEEETTTCHVEEQAYEGTPTFHLPDGDCVPSITILETSEDGQRVVYYDIIETHDYAASYKETPETLMVKVKDPLAIASQVYVEDQGGSATEVKIEPEVTIQ